jgi:LysR family transcriptional regulator, hca operon transcriptional activator
MARIKPKRRINLKHMEAALAVAETLSFSRAAKRLHISQPAVTKYIGELEESLGVLLFIRAHHTVSLTEAGRAYVEEARIVVLHAGRAVQAARAAQQEAELILNVGRSPYVDPYFTSMLLAIRLPLFPRLHMHLSSGFSCDLTQDVLNGDLDIAVVIEPPQSGQLADFEIDESPFYVAMSREDQLAQLPALDLEHLSRRRWLLFQRNSHPPLYDLIQKLADEGHVVPSALQHFMVPEECLPLLLDPGGIVIAPKSGALRIARDGLTMRPLDDVRLRMKTQLISRADNPSPAISELFRTFMRRLKQMRVDSQMSLPLST